MRVLRALFVALLTAFAGCLLAFFVGDYLTRLAHMSNMEGGRGMFIVFVCAPLGILVGLVIGIVSSILVRREGLAGFLVARPRRSAGRRSLSAIGQTSEDRRKALRVAVRASRAGNIQNSRPTRRLQHTGRSLYR